MNKKQKQSDPRLAVYALPRHSGKDVGALIGALEDLKARRKDVLVRSDDIRVSGWQEQDGVVDYDLRIPGLGEVKLSKQFHRQMGSKLSIPAKYYDRVAEKLPRLYRDTTEGWLAEERKPRLVRAFVVGNPDTDHPNQQERTVLRAFLSERYRIIDHCDVALTALQEAAQVLDKAPLCTNWSVSPTNLDVSLTTTEGAIDIRTGLPPTPDQMEPALRVYEDTLRGLRNGRDGKHTFISPDQPGGGVMFPTSRIRNSETGHGGMHVGVAGYIAYCANLAHLDVDLVQVHLGKTLSEELIKSEETRRRENELVFEKVKDATRAAFETETFQKVVAVYRGAREVEVDPADVHKAIVERADLSQDAADAIKALYCRQVDYSVDTLFDAAQAVTAYASIIREDDADLANEIEVAAGKYVAAGVA